MTSEVIIDAQPKEISIALLETNDWLNTSVSQEKLVSRLETSTWQKLKN